MEFTGDPDVFQPSAQNEQDKLLLVKFYIKPRQDMAATEEEGRIVFKDVEYISIKIPGDLNGGVARPATFVDKQRFAEHYRAYKSRVAAPETGTPLSEWPGVSRAQVEELAHINIKTVEQLAAVGDNHTQGRLGLSTLKSKAANYLVAATKSNNGTAALEATVAEQAELIKAMSEKLDALGVKEESAGADESAEVADVTKPSTRTQRRQPRAKTE